MIVVAEEDFVAADSGVGGGCVCEEGHFGEDGEEMWEVHNVVVTENSLRKLLTRGHGVDLRAASGYAKVL